MTKKITLIRHGQSKFNAKEIDSQDLSNCSLSNAGKLQAQNLAQTFDILIVSSLRRAIETYEHSNIKTNNVLVSDLFREQSKQYHEGNQLILENETDMRLRVKEAIVFIKKLECINIGVISHAHFIWYFLEQCNMEPILLKNAETIVIEL